MPDTIKPDRNSFILWRFAKKLAWIIFLISALYFAQSFFLKVSIVYFMALSLVLAIFSYISLSAKYGKESYEFHQGQLIQSSGGIFSDSRTELVLKNVTHISMTLPFLEHLIFHTGTIRVESAASGRTEINLSSIQDPEKVYSHIQELLKHNGFKLRQDKLVQEEKPSMLGVFFEVFGVFFVVSLLMLYLSLGLMGIVEMPWLILLLPGLLAIVFGLCLLNFLDLKLRVYKIYSDAITYTDGFLTKKYSLIPLENYSDSSVRQSTLEMVFGIYDIVLSCAGVDQEIHFKNMRDGPRLEENIDMLLAEFRSSQAVKAGKVELTHHAGMIMRDNEYTAMLKMNTMRTIALPLSLLGIWFLALPLVFFSLPIIVYLLEAAVFIVTIIVEALIRSGATEYEIRPGSIMQKYKFFEAKTKEFSTDKITGVVIRENLIDRFLGTCTITFWSIGSADSIIFSNIKKSDEQIIKILAKTGIARQQAIHNIRPRLSLRSMLTSAFFVNLSAGVLSLGFLAASVILSPLLVLPMVLIAAIYAIVYALQQMHFRDARLEFYKDYLSYAAGFIVKTTYYALYDNVKNQAAVKYPLDEAGKLILFIGGEHIYKPDSKDSAATVSNSFGVDYVSGIMARFEIVDLILSDRPYPAKIKEIESDIDSYMEKPKRISRPSVANPMLSATLISVIIFPLIIILPLTLAYIFLWTKSKSYQIESFRVTEKSGIFYKTQKSILFSRIDHLNVRQGVSGKIFKNGTVTVETIGTRSPELIASDLPDFRDFHDLLERNYK